MTDKGGRASLLPNKPGMTGSNENEMRSPMSLRLKLRLGGVLT